MGFRECDFERMLLSSSRKYPLRKMRPSPPPSLSSLSSTLTTSSKTASAAVGNNNKLNETKVNDVGVVTNNEVENKVGWISKKERKKESHNNNNNYTNFLIRYTGNGL